MATRPTTIGDTGDRHRSQSNRSAWGFLTRNATLSAGALCLLMVTGSAVGAGLLGTRDPQAMRPVARLRPPSPDQWFGTDHYGRDLCARTLYGGRVSLAIGSAVAILSLGIGTAIRLVGGYFRRLDAVVMRVMDELMAIPGILLALALMALVRASLRSVIIALMVPEIPRTVRLVRASVLSLREQIMVESTRAVGAGTPRILLRYILPALVAPLIVQGTDICASAILVEAYLSFLGVGTPPHIPSWGNIMAEGRAYVQIAFWFILFPGLFLAATVLAINMIGDGLRDVLEVR
ncbi:MAG TPA: ABC transporter permease [Candidatus Methylomirabilis sp.]|nr:ABC transporter permease [Candidatus Methylomirabilis sp.]